MGTLVMNPRIGVVVHEILERRPCVALPFLVGAAGLPDAEAQSACVDSPEDERRRESNG